MKKTFVDKCAKNGATTMDNSIPSKEEQILEMFKWLEESAEALGGCSDGNCVIHKPKGMHTNGGC